MGKVIAIRGATTVNQDTPKEIVQKTTELIAEMVSRNELNDPAARCISVHISTTQDIRSFYPARAVRESGLLDAPLFSCAEPDIAGALPLCIRVMLTAESNADAARHVYLHGAAVLRPDLCKEEETK